MDKNEDQKPHSLDSESGELEDKEAENEPRIRFLDSPLPSLYTLTNLNQK